jgi:hypothetical protein
VNNKSLETKRASERGSYNVAINISRAEELANLEPKEGDKKPRNRKE